MSHDTSVNRPIYGSLTPIEANAHLIIADDEGGAVVLEMAQGTDKDFWTNTELLYINSKPGSDADYSEALATLGCTKMYVGSSIEAAQSRMTNSLSRLKMGTQIYLTGSEQLLNVAMMLALQEGFDHHSLQTEHRGSWARRVQCVHCKGITANVTTQPAECVHCGLLLFVRDHYSRRLGAFQGVNINAEDPTDVPEKVETFL